ncbi:MAG: 2-amino-4-hydroxy-6-hydroxymethyldihydropteridine diphosphokinase [Actinomycetota bacterium]|nr:2-amino-4-hydroxy-6-hydroxymethyldihydropteridine diphosphokinase [Actinomycetota bacterium]
MADTVQAFIGIGSNVGDRTGFCRRAVAELADTGGIDVVGTSSLYETTPLGGPPQRSFVNLVVELATSLDARGLLEVCKGIEQRLGRGDADIRWGPRVVDLDILTFDAEKISEPDLEIPHPRMTQRRFVLVPLFELAPDAADPWGGPYRDHIDEAMGEVELLEAF